MHHKFQTQFFELEGAQIMLINTVYPLSGLWDAVYRQTDWKSTFWINFMQFLQIIPQNAYSVLETYYNVSSLLLPTDFLCMSCAGVPSVTKHSIAVPCMIFMFCHMFQKKSSHLCAVSVLADSTVRLYCASMRECTSLERRDSSIHVTFVLRSKCLHASVSARWKHALTQQSSNKNFLWPFYVLWPHVIKYVTSHMHDIPYKEGFY